MTNTTVEQLKKQIDSKEKLIAKRRDELSALMVELRNVCTHEHTVVTERYFDGGYLNKAYTEYRTKCSDCGADLGTRTETHSYYG